jgi:hypothetical protein
MVNSSSTDFQQVVEVLADALERLGARIHRDLNVETREAAAPEDPVWEVTLRRFTTFADECLQVLDDDRVLAALNSAARKA